MTLPKTDDFYNGSSATERIYDYDAGWAENGAAWTVLGATSVDVYCSTAGADDEDACHWQGDTFDNNQYALANLNAVGSNGIGVAVRVHSGSTQEYYGFYASSLSHWLFKYMGGWIQIASIDNTDGYVGEEICLQIIGSTLYPKIEGTIWAQGEQTEDTIASGYAGLCAYLNGTDSRIDNFEGGNLGGVPLSVDISQATSRKTGPVVYT